MKRIAPYIGPLLAVVLLAGMVWLSWAMWQIQKKWNYSWSYESMVKQTVREMVKAEALKP